MSRRGRPPKGATSLGPTQHFPAMIALWDRALAEPHGIRIASEKVATLATMLYQARRELGAGKWDGLKVVRDEGAVWIVPR